PRTASLPGRDGRRETPARRAALLAATVARADTPGRGCLREPGMATIPARGPGASQPPAAECPGFRSTRCYRGALEPRTFSFTAAISSLLISTPGAAYSGRHAWDCILRETFMGLFISARLSGAASLYCNTNSMPWALA